MSVNVADKIQILKGVSSNGTHILKIENTNHETLWEYTEPTITGNDLLYAIDNATGTVDFSWDKQPEIYHCINDGQDKIFFYKYSNFDHTDCPGMSYYFFTGERAWTDGTDTYINNWKYNASTNTWTYIDWQISGSHLYIDGEYIWSDGTDVYYLAPSNISHITSSQSFKFDKSTNTWTPWSYALPTSVDTDGRKIWTDGNDVYYSDGTKQYQWYKTTRQWKIKSWRYADEWLGVDGLYGDQLVTINNTVYGYFIRSGHGPIWFLNENGMWEESYTDPDNYVRTIMFRAQYNVFTDGSNVYVPDWSQSDLYEYLYIITADSDHILSVTRTLVRSVPKTPSGTFLGRRFFSLGLNAKKPDSHARLYSTTIF